MTIEFCVYDESSGEMKITGMISDNDNDLSWLEAGKKLLKVKADQQLQYIDVATDQVKDKKNMIASANLSSVVANGVDQIIISSLEVGTEVIIDNDPKGIYVATSLEITFDAIGEHVIQLKKPQYFDKEFVINAN